MKIQLVDRDSEMCAAWQEEFKDCDDVVIHNGDFFEPETDCIVSPANSFGFMDGGLDGVITRRLGTQVQANVQEFIDSTDMKELLVGQAVIVPTENKRIPFCISAPTMRVSSVIADTVNVYLVSKAVFSLLNRVLVLESRINTVTMSGLGTGVGRVRHDVCARQMRQAYDDVWLGDGKLEQSFTSAKLKHHSLTIGKKQS